MLYIGYKGTNKYVENTQNKPYFLRFYCKFIAFHHIFHYLCTCMLGNACLHVNIRKRLRQ